MNPDQIFSSFEKFWASVGLIVYIHLIALVALRYIVGVRFRPLVWLKQFRSGRRARERRALLEEFGLWTKLPYFGILALILYFVIFASTAALVLQIVNNQWVDFHQTEARWIELQPTSDAVTIASVGASERPTLNDLSATRDNLLFDYKARFPDLYRSWVGWHDGSVRTAIFLYESAILFLLVLVTIGLVVSLKNKPVPWSRRLRYILLLALVAFLLIPALRYRAEVQLTDRYDASIYFVARQIPFDDKRTPMSGERLARLKAYISSTLFNCKTATPFRQFWLSREVAGTWYGSVLRHLADSPEYVDVCRSRRGS